MGSLERFIGVLIEHTAGKFPLWYAPVQLKVIPVSEKFNDVAKKIVNEVRRADIRVELDARNERVGYKIRDAETLKIPYMIVIGQQEEESGMLKLRHQGGKELSPMPVTDMINLLKEQENSRE